MTALKTKKLDPQIGQRVIGYIRNAYEDYLASRILLNNNLLLQGAILANTSIEKYFKAILTFKGDTVKRSHSITRLLPSIRNFDKDLYNKLDREFIATIEKSYPLRYIDTVLKNTKLALRKKEVLANLDHLDRKSTRLNSSHIQKSRMPSSA